MREALVVGINSYQFLPSLQAPARDAEAIAQRLSCDGEFRVQRLPGILKEGKPQVGLKTKVSLRQLETALVNLFKPRGNTIPQTALFYFSGHGIQKDAGIQEGYLAVSDADPEQGFYGLSLFWLRRLLQESPVRQRIIWLDCCHSGELLNFLEADPGARAGTDRMFMAASREYEPAYESAQSPYSVFTAALLEGLTPQRSETQVVTNHSLTSWVSHALRHELQQPLFENSGSEIVLTRGGDRPQLATTVIDRDICPYRGFACFDEAQTDYFFGRENLTEQLIETVKQDRFVAVVGASGSGKSSLVRAGLVGALRQGKKLPGSDRWTIRLMTPTESPLRSLASVFVNGDRDNLERAEQLRRAELFLQNRETGLEQLVRASLPVMVQTSGIQTIQRSRFLLVIDQFEELFSPGQETTVEQERQLFLDGLFHALERAGDCFSVVIVVRSDFLRNCTLYHPLAEQIEQHLFSVQPLTEDQLKAAITRPAEKVGLQCEANLVQTILQDILGCPGQLPLLQYTLLQLWRQRQLDPTLGKPILTLDTYTQLGGVRGLLQKRATEVFYYLSVEEQSIAKRIFLALTQLGEGTEDTRRRVPQSELMSPGFSAALVERTLEKLVAAKLVVTDRDRTDPIALAEPFPFPVEEAPDELELSLATTADSLYQETVDVAHETLIRNWVLLRQWLDENRELLRRKRRIERAALEWERVGNPISTEYLLQGSRLTDAVDLIHSFPNELSALAQEFVAVSQTEQRRTRRDSRLLQITVPSVLFAALLMTVNQYRNGMLNQAETDYQLRLATSRERAAIAQSILQQPDGDPMAALLISRLAIEQGAYTAEAQRSLRAALQALQLQGEFAATGEVRQIRFSPDQRYLAIAETGGIVRLWQLAPQTVYVAPMEPWKTLSWQQSQAAIAPSGSVSESETGSTQEIQDLAISPDGKWVAAIAQDSTQVKVWSVETGNQAFLLELPQAVTQIAFSAQGDWLATVSDDQTVTLWRASTGQLQHRLPLTAPVRSLQFSPDGTTLLMGLEQSLQLWHLASLASPTALPTSLPHSTPIIDTQYSPDGRWIATTGEDGVVRLWDASVGKLLQMVTPPAEEMTASLPTAIASNPSATQPLLRSQFSADGKWLITQAQSGKVWVWAIASGQLQTVLDPAVEFSESQITPDSLAPIPPAISSDGRWILTAAAIATAQGTYPVQMWDLQTGDLIATLPGHAAPIRAIQFSPDGTYIVSASETGEVRLWATHPGSELPTLTAPAPIRDLTFVSPGAIASSSAPSHNSQLDLESMGSPPVSSSQALALMVRSTDGRLSQWDIHQPPALNPVSTATPSPIISWFSPGQLWQQFLGLLQVQSHSSREPQDETLGQSPGSSVEEQAQALLEAFPVPISLEDGGGAIAFSADGRWVARVTDRGVIELQGRSPDTAPVLLPLPNLPALPTDLPPDWQTLTFSPDGLFLLGILHHQILLWDTETHQPLPPLVLPRGSIETAVFSPSGQQILTTSTDQTVRLWQVTTGRLLQTVALDAGIRNADLSPDERWLVLTTTDGRALLFNLETATLALAFDGHPGGAIAAQFSPDGTLVATAGRDRTVRLWNPHSGKEQARFPEEIPEFSSQEDTPAIQQIRFSPNGRYIAALTDAGQIRLWAASREALLQLARDRSDRQLTPEECQHYLHLEVSRCPMLPFRENPGL